MPSESPIERRLAQQLGHHLFTLRTDRGLSQEDVAHAAGMSRNHYQLLEQGLSDRAKKTASNPRLSTLIALAKVLDIGVTDLMVLLFGEPTGGSRSLPTRSKVATLGAATSKTVLHQATSPKAAKAVESQAKPLAPSAPASPAPMAKKTTASKEPAQPRVRLSPGRRPAESPTPTVSPSASPQGRKPTKKRT